MPRIPKRYLALISAVSFLAMATGHSPLLLGLFLASSIALLVEITKN